MRKILSVILTPLYLLIFALLLLIFHPIQVFTRWIWGYPVRKKVVDVLNFGLLYSLWILGTKITFRGFEKIPANPSEFARYCCGGGGFQKKSPKIYLEN